MEEFLLCSTFSDAFKHAPSNSGTNIGMESENNLMSEGSFAIHRLDDLKTGEPKLSPLEGGIKKIGC
jgi:hypothetical protein